VFDVLCHCKAELQRTVVSDVVNSAVLSKADVARQRDAGYRYGDIRYSSDNDM